MIKKSEKHTVDNRGRTRNKTPRDPVTGKFKRADSKQTHIERWNELGVSGFNEWLSHIQPRILTQSNRFEVFEPTQKQRVIFEQMLSMNDRGDYGYSMSILIWPRRHGKSTIFALILLWLLTSKENYTIQLLGNSEIHSRRVQFNTLKNIVLHTPKLRRLISEKFILSFEIKCNSTGSVIQMQTGVNVATSFGSKSNVIWVSDFHACPDLAPWNALQASLLDSEGSLCLIDSNVDATDGHVHELQKEAEHDETIFCNYISYHDFNHYCEEAPPWIDRIKARRLEKTVLPVDFKRDILGQRSDAKNALFSKEIRDLCKRSYKLPVSDLKDLTKGRAYKVGAGLDRAKSLSPAFGGDSTVWTVILKLASPEHGEPVFYILNQEIFPLNSSRLIKKSILRDHDRYKLDNVVLENYEITDLAPYLGDMKIPYEIVTATDTAQNSAFPEMYRIFVEGRFRYSESLKRFDSELSTFAYLQRKGGRGYSFGHASQKFHDDTVYSTAWAIYGLRTAIMSLYKLGNISCQLKSNRRHVCFLMGGGLELFCKESCPAYEEVAAMFREFKSHQLESELTIQNFFDLKVKLEGARVYQAA